MYLARTWLVPAVGVPGRSRADLSWAAPDTLNSVSG
jgi:hypothetical protein